MVDYVLEHSPRSASQIKTWLLTTLGIDLSISSIRSYLAKNDFRYKRMRRSVKHKRDQTMFDFFQREIAVLHQQEAEGLIDVYYFDETGISLTPVVPYAWQPIGKTNRLPSLPSRNQTIVGFMNKKCRFHGFRFDGAATAQTTIACFDSFVKSISKKTIVILDNASIHKAMIVKQKMEEWRSKGLYLQFIPPYSPELNLIERLWKELKYQWLNKTQYFYDLKSLTIHIEQVMKNIGTKYTLNFK